MQADSADSAARGRSRETAPRQLGGLCAGRVGYYGVASRACIGVLTCCIRAHRVSWPRLCLFLIKLRWMWSDDEHGVGTLGVHSRLWGGRRYLFVEIALSRRCRAACHVIRRRGLCKQSAAACAPRVSPRRRHAERLSREARPRPVDRGDEAWAERGDAGSADATEVGEPQENSLDRPRAAWEEPCGVAESVKAAKRRVRRQARAWLSLTRDDEVTRMTRRRRGRRVRA